jgi:hypothetical protein
MQIHLHKIMAFFYLNANALQIIENIGMKRKKKIFDQNK